MSDKRSRKSFLVFEPSVLCLSFVCLKTYQCPLEIRVDRQLRFEPPFQRLHLLSNYVEGCHSRLSSLSSQVVVSLNKAMRPRTFWRAVASNVQLVEPYPKGYGLQPMIFSGVPIAQQLAWGCAGALAFGERLHTVDDNRAITLSTLYPAPFTAREIVNNLTYPIGFDIKSLQVIYHDIGG